MTLRISHSRRELIRNAAMIGGAVLAGGIAPRPSQAAPLPEVKPETFGSIHGVFKLPMICWRSGPQVRRLRFRVGRFWWAVSGRQWHRGTLADKARSPMRSQFATMRCFTWRR